MANSLSLTQRTPPHGMTDSDASTIQLTPRQNFRNLEKEHSEMDLLDTFLTNRNSKSCIATRKRKLSGACKESEAEILAMRERIEKLERTVNDLAILMKETGTYT